MENEFQELIDYVLCKYNIEHDEEDIDKIMKSYGLKHRSKFVELPHEIKIPFSEEDLDRMQNNETFDWNFDGVDVHLYKGDEINEEDEE